MPTASLDLTGMASYELFLRGMLDKIGAYPDALHIGEYKTASNTFTEHTYTPAHREMACRSTPISTSSWCAASPTAATRAEADVRTLIDHGPFLPEDALRAGLIDDLAYEDELDDKVKLATGKAALRRHERLPPGRDRVARPRSRPEDRRDLRGRHRSHRARAATTRRRGQVVGSDTLDRVPAQGARRHSIKAIVLRIDSPGGSAIASDVIWREVMLTHEPEAADRVDVRRRRLGRLLHRDAGARDRRASRPRSPDRSAS